jgi:DNA-binding NarL/FixJ family response regulator
MSEFIGIIKENTLNCQHKATELNLYSIIFSELTDSEVNVIRYILVDALNKSIALELNVEVDTIDKKIRSIKSKLKVKSKIGIKSVAIERINDYNFNKIEEISNKLDFIISGS